VSFEATGPAGLSIKGSTKLALTDEAEKLTFVVPTTDLKTGIGLRDDHLRKHIKAKEHPVATLVIDRDKVAAPTTAAGKVSRQVQAELTFHGVARSVQVSYTIQKGEGGGYRVVADFNLVLTDFGIEEPCYLGVCVKKTVRVSADLTVTRG